MKKIKLGPPIKTRPYTDEEKEEYWHRVAAYQEELDTAIHDLAEKHGIEVAYYKSEDREGPWEIDGRPASDLTHTFQVCDAEASEQKRKSKPLAKRRKTA